MKCQNIFSEKKKKKRAKMALYLSPDYQMNLPFNSGEEVQNKFPR